MGFEAAFEEDAKLPCDGSVVGQPVEILSIGRGENRRELIATCQRNGCRYEIALLDIELDVRPQHRTPSRRLSSLETV